MLEVIKTHKLVYCFSEFSLQDNNKVHHVPVNLLQMESRIE